MSEDTHPLEEKQSRMERCEPAAMVAADAPILREKAQAVPLDEINELVVPHIYPMRDRMRSGVADMPAGVGLAAPQIGVPYRFFLMLDEGRVAVVINPVIHKFLGERRSAEEGCLSFPGRGQVMVPRWSKILLEWRRSDGQKRVQYFRGMAARIIQHETDHLDGICIFPSEPSTPQSNG